MLLMGDEVRRTQHGNNNAYCQDNSLSWFDWNLVSRHQDLLRYTRMLIHARLNRDMATQRDGKGLNEIIQEATMTWHGVKLYQPDWSYHARAIAVTIVSLTGNMRIHYMLNAWESPLDFEIPPAEAGLSWKRWLDTSLPSPYDVMPWTQGHPVDGPVYTVASRSIAILFSMKV
jgi:glycogen operon protein